MVDVIDVPPGSDLLHLLAFDAEVSLPVEVGAPPAPSVQGSSVLAETPPARQAELPSLSSSSTGKAQDELSIRASESFELGEPEPHTSHSHDSQTGSQVTSQSTTAASEAGRASVQPVLKAALARLGLDTAPAAVPKPNVFFRGSTQPSTWVMPPSAPYIEELQRCWADPRRLSHLPRDCRVLAAMQDAPTYGLQNMPNIEPPVAALVLSPNEALRPDARCPRAQCRVTDDLIVRSYDMAARMGHIGNSMSHLMLALTETLQGTDQTSSQELCDTSLQALAYMTRELGRLMSYLTLARRQIWLAQSPLAEPDRRVLRSLPVLPGELFGQAAQQALDRSTQLPVRSHDAQMGFVALPLPGLAALHRITEPRLVAPLETREGGRADGDNITPAVGRFSSQQLERWKAITPDPWVLATLSRGYSIQFQRRPPRFRGVKDTIVSHPGKALALRQEINALLEKGAITLIDSQTQDGGFYSTYFVIPKKDGGLRPILDLRPLNTHLKVLKFHMLHTVDVLQSIQEGDWFTTIDLKDAYFHVPIVPHHRQFLRFAFEGQAYQFCVLPFGKALAPRVFTRCIAAALGPLQARGMRILPYLDDWLICSQSEAQARMEAAAVVANVSELGLKVNHQKSSLRRVHNIRQLAGRFRRGRLLTLRTFQQLMGMLTAASSLVPLGLLTLRPFQRWLNNRHLHPARHVHRLVRATHSCRRLLRPWGMREYLMQGVPLGSIPSRREVITTDASQEGWGAVWQCRTVRGCWSPLQQQQHINVLELQAVFFGLQHFLPEVAGRHVLVRTDNTTVVYYINHQGGTRSLQCLKIAQQLLPWANQHLASLRAMYLPGISNRAADLLSRQNPNPGEWRLHPAVVQTIWEHYGRAEVDLFASQDSTHCPLWFSLSEPSPLGQDALAHAWPRRRLYAFPPLPLILPTLHRIIVEHHETLMIAPRWPGRVWFPMLLRLLHGEPWCLPVRKDLLSQMGGQIWHPDPARLQLWVWPLKGQTLC
ncbi:uncharacterized protein [Misgurnus anguillicaudatus]|uniref:uncharacterized protein n=1 Tax=Misgurnus anguillicaudatus TaxID=75329 RepID=UPI003CCF913C